MTANAEVIDVITEVLQRVDPSGITDDEAPREYRPEAVQLADEVSEIGFLTARTVKECIHSCLGDDLSDETAERITDAVNMRLLSGQVRAT